MSARVTAADILAAIRRKHSSDAVVREVVIDDPRVEAERRRAKVDGPQGDYWADYYAKQGLVVAESLPEGFQMYGTPPRRRIDALILTGRQTTAVEIKVTRADFRRETPEKRRAWLAVADRFVYVAPVGVIPREEVPAGCGLWEFDPEIAGERRWEHGLSVVVKAKLNKAPEPLPRQVLVSLAYRVGRYEATP